MRFPRRPSGSGEQYPVRRGKSWQGRCVPWIGSPGVGVRKIPGSQNVWRIQGRDYRVVYEVHDDRSLGAIIRVDRRRERTYRGL